MNFLIKGPNGFVEIEIKEVFNYPAHTCMWGGYETTSKLTFRGSRFLMEKELYLSTGEIYNFYNELYTAHSLLKGEAELFHESIPLLTVSYDGTGNVIVKGELSDHDKDGNFLRFKLETDQSYIVETLINIRQIVNEYGDNTGKKTKI
ncbi:WapI family immunity protein [Spirosoma litoris]